MMSYVHACVCIHMHVHMCGGTLSPPATHIHPPPPPGGTPGINQNSIAIPFEDLKSVETSPPMGGCMVWWVDGWVDGWGQVKTLKI